MRWVWLGLVACVMCTVCIGSAAAETVPADEAFDAHVVAVSKVVATSERKAPDVHDRAGYAFDGIDYPGVYTSWCTADGEGQGGEVTVTFAEAQLIDEVSIDVGAGAMVRALDVVVDGQAFRAVPDKKSRADAKVGVVARALTVRFADVASSKDGACLSQVTLLRGGISLQLVQGVPAKAVAPRQLGKALLALNAAAQGCKAGKLGKLAAFPVGYDYIGGGDQTAHGQHKSAGVLARYCKGRGLGRVSATTPEAAMDALQTSGEPGQIAATLDDGRLWILRWRRGRWLLVAIQGLVTPEKP